MTSSTLKNGVPVAPFMAFLPRRLAIRYLVSKSRAGDPSEFFLAEVLFLSPSPLAPFEFLHLNHSVYFGSRLTDNTPLWLEGSWGDQEHVEAKVSAILQKWKDASVNHRPQGRWLQPDEFVGVTQIETGNLPESGARDMRRHEASSAQFMFHHALLATRITQHASKLQDAKNWERSLRPLADAVERMSERFNSFAAQSRHAMAAQTLAK